MSGDHHDEQTALLTGIWSEIKTVHQAMSRRFDAVDSRLDRVETRLDNVETRLDSMETRLDSVETHLVLLDGSMRELASQQLDLTRFVRASVERHDTDIDDLRRRMEGSALRS